MITTDRGAGTCAAVITWQGGAVAALTVPLPRRGSGAITTSDDTMDLIRQLAARYNDTTTARILGRQQRTTATGPEAAVSVGGQDDVMATIPRAAQMLGVDRTTLYRWLREGYVTGEQLTRAAP